MYFLISLAFQTSKSLWFVLLLAPIGAGEEVRTGALGEEAGGSPSDHYTSSRYSINLESLYHIKLGGGKQGYILHGPSAVHSLVGKWADRGV